MKTVVLLVILFSLSSFSASNDMDIRVYEGDASDIKWQTIFFDDSKNLIAKRDLDFTKSIEVPEPAMVDGGFNFFVKSEWKRIRNGQTPYFNYISVSRQNYYRFQLSIINDYIDNNQVVIKMEPANFFIRTVLDPILISYNSETKRIVNYKGISTIKDSKRKNHLTTLTYQTVGP